MAIAMLVPDAGGTEPTLGPETAERLAALGISRVALLRDPAGVGVVLEGWAFDPADLDDAVRVVFPDGAEGVRTLREIGLVALAPWQEGRR